MTSAEAYAARIDAVEAQRQRLFGSAADDDRWAGERARRFRVDPHRPLDASLAAVASYIEPDDVVIDVGGGAGRIGLPLALRCRELINVDPSEGMQAQFEAAVAEAGIGNARYILSEWEKAPALAGDVALTFNVTYFVREIVPFIEKLIASARRRVVISVWSAPPPTHGARLFELLWGESQEFVPGHRELLPVLWDLGLLPEVRVLPGRFERGPGAAPTLEEAISGAAQRLGPGDQERATAVLRQHADTLFERTDVGFRPTWLPDPRELLITWETR